MVMSIEFPRWPSGGTYIEYVHTGTGAVDDTCLLSDRRRAVHIRCSIRVWESSSRSQIDRRFVAAISLARVPGFPQCPKT